LDEARLYYRCKAAAQIRVGPRWEVKQGEVCRGGKSKNSGKKW